MPPRGFQRQRLHTAHPTGVLEALSKIFSRPLPPSGPRDLNRKRGWTHKQVSNEKLRATGWQPEFPSFLDAAGLIAPTL